MAATKGGTPTTKVFGAKLGVPTSRLDVVSRPRLLDRLEGTRARVVLVSAPAGAGKSVLVADWVRAGGHPTAWLSLDSLDNDPSRFFEHLGAALSGVDAPGFQDAAEAAHRVARGGGSPAGDLLPALASADAGAVVVLDDVHVLEAEPLVEFVRDLAVGLAEGPRWVLVTRVDPPVPLGRLRLSGELLEIRQHDLRFTGEETSALFHQSLPAPLSADSVRRLEERTEGWAAGLRLAAVALRQSSDPEGAARSFAGSHELLVDYLLEEAVGRQPDALQRFLMETSVLSRFTAEACAAVTGDPAAAEHLERIQDANLFLVTLDDGGTWYRYHQLFAELLEFRLRSTFPERVEGLRRRASVWFEGRGDIQEALGHAARMKDPRRVAEILDTHGYEILARSEFAAFSRWLGHVPDTVAADFPMFLVALAWFRAQTGRTPKLEGLMDRIQALVDDPPEGYPPGRVREAGLHLRALRAYALRVSGDFDQAIAVAEEVLSELPPDAVTIRGVLEFHVGAIYLRLGRMNEARRFLEAAAATCLESGGVPYLVLASLGHLGAVTAQIEGVTAARQRLEGAVAFAGESGLDAVPAFAIVLGQLAQVHLLAGEVEPARTYLERARALTRDERDSDIHANVLIHLARVEVAEGRYDEAEALLASASGLALARKVTPFATTLEVERQRLAEAAGTAPPATGATGGEGTDGSVPWTVEREAEAILDLQRCLKLGHLDDARRLVEKLSQEAEPGARGVALLVAGIAQAALTQDAGRRREEVTRALRLAVERDYVQPLVECGFPARGLLEAALGYPLPPALGRFVRSRVLPRMPDEPGPGEATVPPPESEALTEREQELLALVGQGKTNAAIARDLYLSINTVKTHLKHIFTKLDAATRTEAVSTARRRGLLPARES